METIEDKLQCHFVFFDKSLTEDRLYECQEWIKANSLREDDSYVCNSAAVFDNPLDKNNFELWYNLTSEPDSFVKKFFFV